jgi:hypothetical protein
LLLKFSPLPAAAAIRDMQPWFQPQRSFDKHSALLSLGLIPLADDWQMILFGNNTFSQGCQCPQNMDIDRTSLEKIL